MSRSACLGGLLLLLAGGFLVAQEAEKKATGRLPNNYGRIGLTEAQRAKIYGVQMKYGEQIDALIKQVEELRQKRDTEIEAVLTPEQRENLKKLTAETAKKTAAKKGAAKDAAADTKADDK
jgi:TolA-binding protein